LRDRGTGEFDKGKRGRAESGEGRAIILIGMGKVLEKQLGRETRCQSGSCGAHRRERLEVSCEWWVLVWDGMYELSMVVVRKQGKRETESV
jgi:hypothetical protein